MQIIQLGNTSDFTKVIQASSVVLVDFWATWCGPCKSQGPILEELAKDEDKGVILKVDVDQMEDLARQFKIVSIPTLIVFKDGVETKRFIGVQDKDILAQAL